MLKIGKELTVLENDKKKTGRYQVTFDASLLPSGIYFLQLPVISVFLHRG